MPTFPKARHLFSRQENDFWDPRQHPESPNDPARHIAYRDSVPPVPEAGQATLIDGPHAIDDSLLVQAAPGHTPGHIPLKLLHPEGDGVFCGDVIHPPLQIYAPDWITQFCQDPVQARATRSAARGVVAVRRFRRPAVPHALRRAARCGDPR